MFNETNNQTINGNSEIPPKGESNMGTSQKSHFIDDEKYEILKNIQQQVFEATEVNPTVRRLVNALITQENLYKVRDRMIESLKQ
jgi:hypothetical protein